MNRRHRHPCRSPRRPRAARAALAGMLLALTALSGGCADGGDETVVVLGPWTGAEGRSFGKVLTSLDDETGRTYVYQGTTSLRETLVAELEADDPPDVAILNSLAELTEYQHQGRLRKLDPETSERAYPPWVPVHGSRAAYWVPLKVDLKSLVWTKDGTRRDTPASWCLGLESGATTGWPGTDWIEDILLHQQGSRYYARWATGGPYGQTGTAPTGGSGRPAPVWRTPQVREAWRTWAALLARDYPRARSDWLTRPDEGGTVPSAGTADGKQASDARPGGLLNTQKGCDHEHQSAFIRYVYRDDRVTWLPSADFIPRAAPENAHVFEVSGDMAAVFSDDPAARTLVEQLSGHDGRARWQREATDEPRPLYPARTDPGPGPSDPLGADLAGTLTGHGVGGKEAEELCFDASDVMPPMLRDAFQRAVLQYVGDMTDATLDSLLRQLDTVTADAYRDSGPAALSYDDVCGPPTR